MQIAKQFQNESFDFENNRITLKCLLLSQEEGDTKETSKAKNNAYRTNAREILQTLQSN